MKPLEQVISEKVMLMRILIVLYLMKVYLFEMQFLSRQLSLSLQQYFVKIVKITPLSICIPRRKLESWALAPRNK